MTVPTFLMLLSSFAVISGLVTEAIKKIVKDRANFSYNITALVVALIIGGVGCSIYYQLNAIPFTTNNIIYIVLMGFSSGLTATLGYDKIKQAILQITGKSE